MRLLDLYCGAGGATKGYQKAGFYVVGVDISSQPNYCGDEFYQGDAIQFIKAHGREFDAIHTSPPCQDYSKTQKLNGLVYPRLIKPTRKVLRKLNIPWIIENVMTAPLRDPIVLCGAMFNLGTYRHRQFETNFGIEAPEHPPHTARTAKMGRMPQPSEFMHVVGNYSGAQQAKDAMGINWMTRREMAESIPPAYTEYIGRHLLKGVK